MQEQRFLTLAMSARPRPKDSSSWAMPTIQPKPRASPMEAHALAGPLFRKVLPTRLGLDALLPRGTVWPVTEASSSSASLAQDA